ncbi:MAG: energy transducer TonB [Acidobacteria bacterium]|nr:energy transducer TonB [Acidobacteriota bacterium]
MAFASANLSRPYFPSRGVPYSLVIHVIAFSGLYLLSVLRGPTEFARRLERARSSDRPAAAKSLQDRVVMYLPIHGGGSRGMGLAGSGSGARRKKPSVVPASSSRGFGYPGPQPIVSDVPYPTNRLQTLLQPGLKNPPILKPPLALPNIVQTADAGPVQRPKPPEEVKPVEPRPAEPPKAEPEVKPAPPVVLPVELQPPMTELPKLVWPAKGLQDTLMPKVKTTEPPQPVQPSHAVQDLSLYKEAAPSEPPPAPVVETGIQPAAESLETPKGPPALEYFPVQMHGPDSHALLALSPVPAAIQKAIEVPAGEARGRFAISPEPNLDAPETEPGSKLEISPLRTGIGSNATAPVGDGAAGNATQGSVPVGAGSGTSSGTGAGSGPGSGSGSVPGPGVSSGSGAGTGRGPGIGVGTGSGSGTGPGTGAGSGPGRGPFRGMTIVGGANYTDAAPNPAPTVRAHRPLQTSWGITVISTENSGGGLPDFGVFSHEQVYTVYLDMRETETDSVPSWTLEFAVVQGTAFQSIATENPGQSQQGLILPFPAVKHRPALPAELVRKYLNRMIIVYAIINTDGKLEQMSVKQSPDTLLNELVLNALSRWVFRPARLNGQPVAAKALMGIPLWSPQ